MSVRPALAPPLTLALLAFSAAPPATAATIPHSGSTSQGARAHVLVHDAFNTVEKVVVGYRSRCGAGSATFRPAPEQEPAFALTRRHRGGVARVAGRWGADGTWRGTFSATLWRDGRRCTVRRVRWEAPPPAGLEPGQLRADFFSPREWRLEVQSEAGDPIGRGASRSYGSPAMIVVRVGGRSRLGLAVIEDSGARLDVSLDAPGHEPLAARRYAPARTFPGNPRTEPGLSIAVDGRRCGAVDGEFTIERIAFARDGALREIAFSFVQRCDGRPEALRGRFELTLR